MTVLSQLQHSGHSGLPPTPLAQGLEQEEDMRKAGWAEEGS